MIRLKECHIFIWSKNPKDLYSLQEIEEIRNNWNKESSFKFIPVLNMEPEDSDWKELVEW